ncbi:MAG: PIN domain nuclease [Acidobacteria bacterium]|nr:MAG: PIN domain nuclease [Acidobacteriota bacterium]
MRLLLDTHVLLWALTEPRRLSRKSRSAIENRRNHLFVSSASAWEIATKIRLGRLPRAEALARSLPEYVDELGASSLPIGLDHGLLAGALEADHADPFDRVLAAQASLEDLKIVTSDPAFEQLGATTYW